MRRPYYLVVLVGCLTLILSLGEQAEKMRVDPAADVRSALSSRAALAEELQSHEVFLSLIVHNSSTPVLVGAGDIADCRFSGDEATALLLDEIVAEHSDAIVYTLGDNIYVDASYQSFLECYHPNWGRHKERTRPAVGNHDYEEPGAAGYFQYFGAAAGDPDKGYYSYNVGEWHVVVLNTECEEIGGCHAGSLQEQWLRADLQAHPSFCTLAYMHHPRWSSTKGIDSDVEPLYQTLYDYGVDLALAGHAHNYERFLPQDPAGKVDHERGIRLIVVGTGGRSHSGFVEILPNSVVRNNDTFGVLMLRLLPTGYEWKFIPEEGKTFSDSGNGICHE